MNEEAKITELLISKFSLSAEKIASDTSIFSDGLLDSLNSLELVMALEQEFGISISPIEISIDDIDSVSKVAGFVRGKMAAKGS